MKWCPNCKMNVYPILKAHPTLQLATLSCPNCETTNLKQPKPLSKL
jgi:hypothetical protein